MSFYDLSILLEFIGIMPTLHSGFLQKCDGDTSNLALVMLPASNTPGGSDFFTNNFKDVLVGQHSSLVLWKI